MYTKLEHFYQAYAQQVESTCKILAVLTDESLKQPVAPGFRTLGQIGWHVVTVIPEMMGRTGLGLSGVDPQSPPSASATEIREGYQRATAELLDALKVNWTDETLQQTDDMYGTPWPRGLTLAVLMRHESHHIGQMTVLMRQAGLQVPGVCGPSKEEWTQFGMEEPPY